MPWVRLDDRFPSHRKVALLSDRAFRLYVSGLCWCSENLTEGRISDRELPLVAPRLRGMKAATADLEAAGLWDRVEGGWMVHDYLEYNPDRARVKADRESNAARQKAYRDRKRAEREAKKAAKQEARNAPSNGVTRNAEDAGNDASTTATRHELDRYSTVTNAENQRSPQVNEIRNGVSNGTPSRPVPPSPSEKEKEDGQLATRATPEAPPRIGDRPRIPDSCHPLVAALGTAGIVGVGWNLSVTDWDVIDGLVARCGITALVASALASRDGARGRVRSGSYFIPAWRSLPDAPPQPAPGERLPAEPGADVLPLTRSRQQQQTDDQFDRAMARAQARMKETS
ncbi:hypothetical protein [Streptomyces sp. DT18]